MDVRTMTLGGVTHAVVLPTRPVVRRELCITYGSNTMRGAAAIVGMCAPSLNLRSNYGLCQCNGIEYGGSVWEELTEAGVPDVDILRAAQSVLADLSGHLFASPVTAAEVADTKGFSSAKEGTTS